MWQSQVENEPFSQWLNSISYPTVMLGQLKPNVGTPLADRLELLKQNLRYSNVSTAEQHSRKPEKVVKKR